MSYRYLLLLWTATFALCATNGSMNYPIAPKSDQVDDYNGTKISDPYRELENADSPATQKWIADENALTFGYLAKIPARAAIRSRLEKLWDYEKYGGMWEAGGHFFYTHNSGLQNQSVVYVQDRLGCGPARSHRPQYLPCGWHRRFIWRGCKLGRKVPRLWRGAGRVRLERLACARDRHGQGSFRRDPLE